MPSSAAHSCRAPLLTSWWRATTSTSSARRRCNRSRTDPYDSRVVLTDGGVYDNLGLETVWKRYDTVLVSDGGGKMKPEPEPHGDWPRHARRVLSLVDNQ